MFEEIDLCLIRWCSIDRIDDQGSYLIPVFCVIFNHMLLIRQIAGKFKQLLLQYVNVFSIFVTHFFFYFSCNRRCLLSIQYK